MHVREDAPIKTPHILTIVITNPTNRPTCHPGWSAVWRRDGGQDLSCHSPHSYLFNFSCEQLSASTSDRERPPRRACPQVCAVIRVCTIHHRRDYKELQKKAARQLRLPPLPASLPPSHECDHPEKLWTLRCGWTTQLILTQPPMHCWFCSFGGICWQWEKA